MTRTPVDDLRLSAQQRLLLRWIAEQVGILPNPNDPDGRGSQMLTPEERARVIARAKGKTIRWSSNKYFGPYHVAYQGVTDAETSSLSRSLKTLEQRGFINRLGDGRIKLTPGGHRYLVTRHSHDAAYLLRETEYPRL